MDGRELFCANGSAHNRSRGGTASRWRHWFRGYATALRTSLPHAIQVLDAFHVTRLGFAAVDDVRRRVQQHDLGHRARKGDPLYSIRRCYAVGTNTSPTSPGIGC
jgi:transposase